MAKFLYKTHLFTVIVAALFASSQLAIVNRSETTTNDFEIIFDKTEVVIPCRCLERKVKAEDEPELQVSIVTSTAVRNPLTFNYAVSGGKVIGSGPIVVWDLDEMAPGTYEISVEITDGENKIGKRISKTVKLIFSPECDCNVSCPSLEIRTDKKAVRPDDKVIFHLSMLGGEFANRTLDYDWTVADGRIESGQGTEEITVLTDKHHESAEVEVSVEVNGLNPSFNCPVRASESVAFGKQSIPNDFPTGPIALRLDDQELVAACPPEKKIRHVRSSPDMIVEAQVESLKPLRGSRIRYEVAAGQILGNGNRVQWDLSNIPPGTYKISAGEWFDGKQYGETVSQTVNIVSAVCMSDPVCPILRINASERTFEPGDTVDVSAMISGLRGSMPILYNWMTSEGQIISGQSSNVVRIKLPSIVEARQPRVTLTIGGLNPDTACPNSVSKEINMQSTP